MAAAAPGPSPRRVTPEEAAAEAAAAAASDSAAAALAAAAVTVTGRNGAVAAAAAATAEGDRPKRPARLRQAGSWAEEDGLHPTHAELVAIVKHNQRDPQWNARWRTCCLSAPGKMRDPAAHSVEFLAAALKRCSRADSGLALLVDAAAASSASGRAPPALRFVVRCSLDAAIPAAAAHTRGVAAGAAGGSPSISSPAMAGSPSLTRGGPPPYYPQHQWQPGISPTSSVPGGGYQVSPSAGCYPHGEAGGAVPLQQGSHSHSGSCGASCGAHSRVPSLISDYEQVVQHRRSLSSDSIPQLLCSSPLGPGAMRPGHSRTASGVSFDGTFPVPADGTALAPPPTAWGPRSPLPPAVCGVAGLPPAGPSAMRRGGAAQHQRTASMEMPPSLASDPHTTDHSGTTPSPAPPSNPSELTEPHGAAAGPAERYEVWYASQHGHHHIPGAAELAAAEQGYGHGEVVPWIGPEGCDPGDELEVEHVQPPPEGWGDGWTVDMFQGQPCGAAEGVDFSAFPMPKPEIRPVGNGLWEAAVHLPAHQPGAQLLCQQGVHGVQEQFPGVELRLSTDSDILDVILRSPDCEMLHGAATFVEYHYLYYGLDLPQPVQMEYQDRLQMMYGYGADFSAAAMQMPEAFLPPMGMDPPVAAAAAAAAAGPCPAACGGRKLGHLPGPAAMPNGCAFPISQMPTYMHGRGRGKQRGRGVVRADVPPMVARSLAAHFAPPGRGGQQPQPWPQGAQQRGGRGAALGTGRGRGDWQGQLPEPALRRLMQQQQQQQQQQQALKQEAEARKRQEKEKGDKKEKGEKKGAKAHAAEAGLSAAAGAAEAEQRGAREEGKTSKAAKKKKAKQQEQHKPTPVDPDTVRLGAVVLTHPDVDFVQNEASLAGGGWSEEQAEHLGRRARVVRFDDADRDWGQVRLAHRDGSEYTWPVSVLLWPGKPPSEEELEAVERAFLADPAAAAADPSGLDPVDPPATRAPQSPPAAAPAAGAPALADASPPRQLPPPVPKQPRAPKQPPSPQAVIDFDTADPAVYSACVALLGTLALASCVARDESLPALPRLLPPRPEQCLWCHQKWCLVTMKQRKGARLRSYRFECSQCAAQHLQSKDSGAVRLARPDHLATPNAVRHAHKAAVGGGAPLSDDQMAGARAAALAAAQHAAAERQRLGLGAPAGAASPVDEDSMSVEGEQPEPQDAAGPGSASPPPGPPSPPGESPPGDAAAGSAAC